MFINQKEYWNKFYSSKVSGEDLSNPSQFAAFALGESFVLILSLTWAVGMDVTLYFLIDTAKRYLHLDNSKSAILSNRHNYGSVTDLTFKVI